MSLSPDPRDLTTVAIVKAWIPVTDASSDDMLQTCITAASLYWLKRTGRSTLNKVLPFNEWYDGSGSDRQYVRNAPIIQVNSVKVGNTTIPQASSDHLQNGWVIDDDRKSIAIVGCIPNTLGRGFGGYGFRKGVQNVNINYLAGYSLQESEPWTVPGTPFQVTVLNSAAFVLDLGVRYVSTGLSLSLVSANPAQGQYSVNSTTGVYTFNSADQNANVVIAYAYNGVPLDIENAVNIQVQLNYKRRDWQGLSSQGNPQLGTTAYTKWEIPPEVERVIQNYTRSAIV